MTGCLYWLASYPKSGNTWARLLLTNYFRDEDQPVDINTLGWGPIASGRSTFDDHVGLQSSDLTDDEIERLRPRVYEHLSRRLEGDQSAIPRFIKVHDAYTLTSHGVPMVSKAATAGVIYVVRNPLDVAVSFARHGGVSTAQMVKNMNDPGFCLGVGSDRTPNQLRQRLLTWGEHVTSWVDEPGLRVLTVRYEDLDSNAPAQLTEVLRFSSVEPVDARVAKAVRFSAFDEVRAQEDHAGFSERPPAAERFFRSGTTGDWRSNLSADLVQQICSDHRGVMERFGYLVDGEPV